MSVQTPMYSTRAFWKKRPIGQVYRKGRNVTSQTPVVSMTTCLILSGTKHQWKQSQMQTQILSVNGPLEICYSCDKKFLPMEVKCVTVGNHCSTGHHLMPTVGEPLL